MDHSLALPLLIGLIALALAFDFLNGLHDAANAIATDVRVDGEETMTARWVTRDEYTAELIAGRMAAPGRATIARYMIEEWLGREL